MNDASWAKAILEAGIGGRVGVLFVIDHNLSALVSNECGEFCWVWSSVFVGFAFGGRSKA
ncbi:hypothetical protein JD969_16055 [Planctomycetota bacterium]|nr:hypothetical protein JD969_16055 [Planctomycetota bacterium]